VVVFHDITERNAWKTNCAGVGERFELPYRAPGRPVGLGPADRRRLFLAAVESMLGYEDHEITHRLEEWEQLLHPDEREQVLAANYDPFRGEDAALRIRVPTAAQDGTYRWILARGVALRDASGRPYRMAGSHVDTTERRQAEEERQRMLERVTAGAVRGGDGRPGRPGGPGSLCGPARNSTIPWPNSSRASSGPRVRTAGSITRTSTGSTTPG